MAKIEPYSFEPMRDHSDSKEGELPGNPEDSRRGNTMWCECQRCANWENQQERECVCCHEIDEAVAKMSDIYAEGLSEDDQNAALQCITEHPSFNTVCLRREVLETAIVGLSQRYAAYRQFTWWVHDRLGKYVRRVIPACVVKEIRAAFPDSQGNYTGFCTPDQSYSEVDLSWIKELV
ncbi:P2X purinoceptor 7-like [Acropora muricata]|uniref:P2X purinoceptor 7-like n=1 Tax=Acropora muricata TaxID=159855 RepID=UPI0034E3EBC9